MRIGFLGLGSRGRPMARNLAGSPHDLVVWNRTRERAESLDGAAVAETPARAAEGADLVITMLSDDDAVHAVTAGEDGVLAGLPEGAIHASMSTISVVASRRLAEEHGARGQRYVAAPVFGRPGRPVFDRLAQGVIEAGSRPEQANVMKLAGNFMLASAIEAMAEAYTLVRAHGVSAALFHETMADRLFRSPIYASYGGMIEARDYQAGFMLSHGLKDIRYGVAAAEEARVPMPVARVLRERLTAAVASGWGEMDWAALGRVAAAQAGRESEAEPG